MALATVRVPTGTDGRGTLLFHGLDHPGGCGLPSTDRLAGCSISDNGKIQGGLGAGHRTQSRRTNQQNPCDLRRRRPHSRGPTQPRPDGRRSSSGPSARAIAARKQVLGDAAYDSDALRLFLTERASTPVIQPNARRKNIPPFDTVAYKRRNLIERAFSHLWPPGVRPLPAKPWSGRGRPPSAIRRDGAHQPILARQLALELPKKAWRRVTWREGTNTKLAARFAAVRVRRKRCGDNGAGIELTIGAGC